VFPLNRLSSRTCLPLLFPIILLFVVSPSPPPPCHPLNPTKEDLSFRPHASSFRVFTTSVFFPNPTSSVLASVSCPFFPPPSLQKFLIKIHLGFPSPSLLKNLCPFCVVSRSLSLTDPSLPFLPRPPLSHKTKRELLGPPFFAPGCLG